MGKCSVFQMYKADERGYCKHVQLGAHVTLATFTPHKHEHRNTAIHTLHQSHSWRSLWLFGQQVRLLDQHVAKETARLGLHHSGSIRCDSSFNICMHARSHSISQMHGTHQNTHSHLCARSDPRTLCTARLRTGQGQMTLVLAANV